MTYHKLVRDKIIDIIKENGETPLYRKLNNIEFKQALRQKLQEEVTEYLEDQTIEELADILEVIYALADLDNCNIHRLEKIRQDKAIQRGGFKNKIFLEEVK